MSRHSVDLRRYGGPEFLAAHPYCGICHHYIPNAPVNGQVDHLISPAERPDLAYDPRNWQASHGVKRCPTCGLCCNQAKGKGRKVTIPTGRTW